MEDSSAGEDKYTESNFDDKYVSIDKYCWNDVRSDYDISLDETEYLGFRQTKIMHVAASISMAHANLTDNSLFYVVTWDRVNTLAFRRTLQYGILGIWMVKLSIEKWSIGKDHIAYMT